LAVFPEFSFRTKVDAERQVDLFPDVAAQLRRFTAGRTSGVLFTTTNPEENQSTEKLGPDSGMRHRVAVAAITQQAVLG
jgi:hypothetical protein